MEESPLGLTKEDCAALDAWRLGSILSAVTPATGTVNKTLIVQSQSGSFVLRVSSREKARVEWEHECIAFAAENGLPVCRPIPLPDHSTVAERGGRFFALFPLAIGQQIERAELNVEHGRAAGECLARIHSAFQSLPAGHARVKNLTGGMEQTLTSIPRIEAAIQAVPTETKTEQIVLEHLEGRRRCMEQNLHLVAGIEQRLAALPQMVLHGDFQETNLFFENDQMSGIIDWDQSGIAARGWEVVRALHLMLGLEPELCHAFLAGYRSVLALPGDELEEAALCYGVLADSNLWVYEAAYLEGNERAKRFIEPGPFISFERQWETSGLKES